MRCCWSSERTPSTDVAVHSLHSDPRVAKVQERCRPNQFYSKASAESLTVNDLWIVVQPSQKAAEFVRASVLNLNLFVAGLAGIAVEHPVKNRRECGDVLKEASPFTVLRLLDIGKRRKQYSRIASQALFW